MEGEVEEGRRGLVWYSLQVCIVRTGCRLQYTLSRLVNQTPPPSTGHLFVTPCTDGKGYVPVPVHDLHDFTNKWPADRWVWFMRLYI